MRGKIGLRLSNQLDHLSLLVFPFLDVPLDHFLLGGKEVTKIQKVKYKLKSINQWQALQKFFFKEKKGLSKKSLHGGSNAPTRKYAIDINTLRRKFSLLIVVIILRTCDFALFC